MFLPEDAKLDIRRLSQVFSNTVATYKYYWFLSIIGRLCEEDRRQFSFYEIIAGMISEAWYPIHYFKLSFGKSDSLYEKIVEIQQLLNIPIDERQNVIREVILSRMGEVDVKKCLKVFTLNVPYWFLSPWIKAKRTKDVELASNCYCGFCPYAINAQTITVSDEWADYIRTNASVLRDFCFWGLTLFLQKRNPNVPDIPNKLVKPLSRNSLSRQRRYWNSFIEERHHINCIYTGKELHKDSFDLDHFVPWSFVVHDYLWDLIPADPSINSSKSNNLPVLETFLKPMALLHKQALEFNYNLHPNDQLLEDYLVFRCPIPEIVGLSDERFIDLYRKLFTPMIQTASNMGFAMWENR